MKFRPGSRPDTAVIQPECFDAPIRVEGISSEMMAGLFHGSAAARAHWVPGLTVTAGLVKNAEPDEFGEAGESDKPDTAPYEQNLPDGLALLRSDAPGNVRVQPGHALADTLLAQSLYLLLAQQWARAGLLLVHGAAFELDGTGVLALGDKGAGKSVLTAAALAAGAKVVSDDWVMVGLDPAGRLRAERLREFMMLRHGQACDQLLTRLRDLRPAPLAKRPKSVFHFHDQPASIRRRFVPTCNIDRIWLLKRPPAGRFQPSARAAASPVQALAALIQATMPILFSRHFAQETVELQKTTNTIFSNNPLYTVRTGPDLLDHPAKVIAAIL